MATLRHLVARDNVPLPDDAPLWDAPLDAATPAQATTFLSHINALYIGNPSLRLTLVKCTATLLVARLDLAPQVVVSPLFQTLLRSLQLDTQPLLLAQGVKLITLLIPHAPAEVAHFVPALGALLLRVAVWRKRVRVGRVPQWGFAAAGAHGEPMNTVPSSSGGFLSWRDPEPRWEQEQDMQAADDCLAQVTPAQRAGLGWRVASSSPKDGRWAAPPSLPDTPASTTDADTDTDSNQDLPRALLIELYGLFPANIVALASDPAAYLHHAALECPYAQEWAEVYRKKETVELMSTALRGFLFNPAILQTTAAQEITDTTRFTRQTTAELRAQSHTLWLGSLLPRSGAGGVGASLVSPVPVPVEVGDRGRQGREASPTETLSSSGGSVTGRYHRAPPGHREAVDSALAAAAAARGAGKTPYTAKTAPISIRTGMMIPPAGAGGVPAGAGGGDSLQDVDALRRDKEFLEVDLRYAKVLAGSYLQHVYRLHEKVVAVITDEAERQNMYNQLKEQTATIRNLRDELRIQRAAVDKAKESIAKMQNEQRETRQIQREEKRARALETSQSRAEIEDQTRMLEAQKLELARVKDAHFKLNNKLREAEPKIKHIADYEKEVDKLYHNQLLWDADIRRQKETESSMNKMMSAFKQMEIVLSRYEKDKQALQTENQRQADRMAEMQSEIARLSAHMETPKQLPEDIASTIRQDLQILQNKLQEARHGIAALEGDKLELEARIEELEYQRMTAATAQATLL